MAEFRPSAIGNFRVFALDMETRKIVSDVHEISVADCGHYVLPEPHHPAGNRKHKKIPKPIYRLSGVAAVNGLDPISIPGVYVSSPLLFF
jgi:hypothetical protein